MREITADERHVIQSVAAKLNPERAKRLLDDLDGAMVEDVLDDGSRVLFHLRGYERPPYRGIRPLEPQPWVRDKDGADVEVLVHTDQNDRLFELELVRYQAGDLIAVDWATLTFDLPDPMSREQQANRLADDLESLVAGHLSETAFRTKYQRDVDGSTLLAAIWGNLEHYWADSDIRDREPAYHAMQNAEIGKLVGLLRTGAPDSELARVTFLGYS